MAATAQDLSPIPNNNESSQMTDGRIG